MVGAMKKLNHLVVASICIMSFALTAGKSVEILDYCTKSSAKTANMREMNPYRYSGNKVKPFYCKAFHQTKTTVVELLKGMPYKIVFNRAGMPDGQKLEIKIFDSEEGKKNRTMIWSDNSMKEQVAFETKSVSDFDYRTLYIEYVLPAYEKEDITDDIRKKGCVVMTTGYMNEVLETKK